MKLQLSLASIAVVIVNGLVSALPAHAARFFTQCYQDRTTQEYRVHYTIVPDDGERIFGARLQFFVAGVQVDFAQRIFKGGTPNTVYGYTEATFPQGARVHTTGVITTSADQAGQGVNDRTRCR